MHIVHDRERERQRDSTSNPWLLFGISDFDAVLPGSRLKLWTEVDHLMGSHWTFAFCWENHPILPLFEIQIISDPYPEYFFGQIQIIWEFGSTPHLRIPCQTSYYVYFVPYALDLGLRMLRSLQLLLSGGSPHECWGPGEDWRSQPKLNLLGSVDALKFMRIEFQDHPIKKD